MLKGVLQALEVARRKAPVYIDVRASTVAPFHDSLRPSLSSIHDIVHGPFVLAWLVEERAKETKMSLMHTSKRFRSRHPLMNNPSVNLAVASCWQQAYHKQPTTYPPAWHHDRNQFWGLVLVFIHEHPQARIHDIKKHGFFQAFLRDI